MKILVFDNYDSFTYNLVHLVKKLCNGDIDVYKNDQLPLEKIKPYDKIILSPGPGLPKDAGQLIPLINEYASTKSILGVCLGHQAIAENFGAKLINLSTVLHGITTSVRCVDGKENSLFYGLHAPFEVGHYHSWIVSDEQFPDELEVTARDEHDYIMALQHNTYDVTGVQFHPESILTPDGETIMKNWLSR
jgi:anthranilate synthase component II